MEEARKNPILMFLMVMSMALLAILFGEVVAWSVKRHNAMSPIPRQQMVILPNKHSHICQENDGKNCSKPLSSYAEYLVDQELKMQDRKGMLSYPPENDTDCQKYAKPSLEVYGPSKSRSCDSAGNGKSHKVLWNSHNPTMDGHGSLDPVYENGDIEIKKSGYYYVSVILRVNTTLVKSENVTQVKHELYRYSSKQRMVSVLLETLKSFCMSDEGGLLTSDVGSGFELDKGDRLFVKTRHCEHLDRDSHGNIFALYMA